MEPISTKFAMAVSYTTLASIVGRVSGLFIAIFMARLLGSYSLGLFTILQATLGTFATIFGFGLGLTGSKMVAQYYINDPKKAGRIIGLLFFSLGITIFLGAGIYWYLQSFISKYFYKMPELLGLLKLSLPWLILMLINQVLEPILSGLQGFKILMITNSIFSILNLLFSLMAFILCKDNLLIGLLIANTMAAFCQLILLMKSISAEVRKYNIFISFERLRPLIGSVLFDFSIPAFIGKLFEQPLSWLSILILVNLTGSPLYAGGLTVITNVRAWILYLPSMLMNVLVPLLTDVYHNKDLVTFRRTLVFNQRYLFFTTFPLLVLVMGMVRPIILLFFGKSYEIFWFAGIILLAWTILIPLNEVNDRAMVAMGKMWLSLTFRIIYLVLFIMGLWYFIPKYNLEGYVIAGGISYFVYVFFQTMWLRSITQEPISSQLLLTTFSVLNLLIAFSVSWFLEGSKAVAFSFTLFFIVLTIEWMWLIKPEEKSIIFAQLKRIFSKVKVNVIKENN